ncbi:MAG: hypothetical protein R2857_10605 [Vampirovibrionales bacterium]
MRCTTTASTTGNTRISSNDIFNFANSIVQSGRDINTFAATLNLTDLTTGTIEQKTGKKVYENSMGYIILGGGVDHGMEGGMYYGGYYGQGIVTFDDWAGLTPPSLKAKERADAILFLAGYAGLPPALLALRDAFMALQNSTDADERRAFQMFVDRFGTNTPPPGQGGGDSGDMMV